MAAAGVCAARRLGLGDDLFKGLFRALEGRLAREDDSLLTLGLPGLPGLLELLGLLGLLTALLEGRGDC